MVKQRNYATEFKRQRAMLIDAGSAGKLEPPSASAESGSVQTTHGLNRLEMGPD